MKANLQVHASKIQGKLQVSIIHFESFILHLEWHLMMLMEEPGKSKRRQFVLLGIFDSGLHCRYCVIVAFGGSCFVFLIN